MQTFAQIQCDVKYFSMYNLNFLAGNSMSLSTDIHCENNKLQFYFYFQPNLTFV